jgi:hypothetical protein
MRNASANAQKAAIVLHTRVTLLKILSTILVPPRTSSHAIFNPDTAKGATDIPPPAVHATKGSREPSRIATRVNSCHSIFRANCRTALPRLAHFLVMPAAEPKALSVGILVFDAHPRGSYGGEKFSGRLA